MNNCSAIIPTVAAVLALASGTAMAEGVDFWKKATDENSDITQAEMNIKAGEDCAAAIADLGRCAAVKALLADSSEEADRVLDEFRRTMERCIDLRRTPYAKNGGSAAPMLAAFDIWQAANRQLCVWRATPEQRARWDNCVAGARGYFRDVPFALRDGQAIVTAPVGHYCFLAEDYSRDPESGLQADSRRWLLETFPQWSAVDTNHTYFVLLANAMDSEGHIGFGETTDEDTLLLFWRANNSQDGKWGCTFLGNQLHPLAGNTNAVSVKNGWLSIETTWRSTENGGSPVIYKLDKFDDEIGAGIYDFAASELHDCGFFHYVQERDALQPSRYAAKGVKKDFSTYYAMWRHPVPESALVDFIREVRPASADFFNPIPVLEGELHEFAMPREVGDSLEAIYAERSTFTILDIEDAAHEVENALVAKWRKEKTPPLLTIRDVSEFTIDGNVRQESVDYSFSRDGGYLVVEEGYLIPETETPDGLTHSRSVGRTVFEIPERLREKVKALLEKASGQPYDWEERCKSPDGCEALGFLVVERMDIGVDDGDTRPSADDMRAKAAGTGVKPGDILVSFCGDVDDVDFTKRTLRESCREYARNWKNSEGDCWFARMGEDGVTVFKCDSGSLFQCEVAWGTAFLRVAPKAFGKADMDRIGNAFSHARKQKDQSHDD